MTRPYAEVIGDPIAHSKSPLIHNFWLKKLGIDAEYRATHVRAEELREYFKSRNADDDWRGCNVTMPHKQAVVALMDELELTAMRVGAVNTVVMRDYYLHGHNTDGQGFMEPLRDNIADRTYRFAYLIGSGGAALAIARALKAEDFRIWSISRSPERSQQILGDYVDEEFMCDLGWLTERHPRINSDADRIDVLINATPLGMTGFPNLFVRYDRFPDGCVAYDIVTKPTKTAFLQKAEEAGWSTIDGLQMLVGQAAAAFELFFNQPAPREHDADLRALLTA